MLPIDSEDAPDGQAYLTTGCLGEVFTFKETLHAGTSAEANRGDAGEEQEGKEASTKETDAS